MKKKKGIKARIATHKRCSCLQLSQQPIVEKNDAQGGATAVFNCVLVFLVQICTCVGKLKIIHLLQGENSSH